MKRILLVLLTILTLGIFSPVGAIDVNPPFNVAIMNDHDAFLTWVAPIENTDDSPLTDLAGFKIYFGTESGNYTEIIDVNSPTLTSYLITDLWIEDTWYFAMTAYNSSGIESSYSLEVNKEIP